MEIREIMRKSNFENKVIYGHYMSTNNEGCLYSTSLLLITNNICVHLIKKVICSYNDDQILSQLVFPLKKYSCSWKKEEIFIFLISWTKINFKIKTKTQLIHIGRLYFKAILQQYKFQSVCVSTVNCELWIKTFSN